VKHLETSCFEVAVERTQAGGGKYVAASLADVSQGMRILNFEKATYTSGAAQMWLERMMWVFEGKVKPKEFGIHIFGY